MAQRFSGRWSLVPRVASMSSQISFDVGDPDFGNRSILTLMPMQAYSISGTYTPSPNHSRTPIKSCLCMQVTILTAMSLSPTRPTP